LAELFKIWLARFPFETFHR